MKLVATDYLQASRTKPSFMESFDRWHWVTLCGNCCAMSAPVKWTHSGLAHPPLQPNWSETGNSFFAK